MSLNSSEIQAGCSLNRGNDNLYPPRLSPAAAIFNRPQHAESEY